MTLAVRRVLAAACMAAAGLVVLSGPTQAAAPACPDPSLARDIHNADVVFRGEVTRVLPVVTTGQRATRPYNVTADRVYQSSLITDRVVVTARVGTKCALPTFQKGTTYIFFVIKGRSRLLATSGTAEATPKLTRQVVARLGTGAQPEVTPPPAARFTVVAGATPPALSRLLAPGAALLIVSVLGLLVLAGRQRRTA